MGTTAREERVLYRTCFLSCPHCDKRIWVWKADMLDVHTIVCPWCYGTFPKRAFWQLEQ